MLRATVLVSACLLATSIAAFGEQRMISIGNRRISVYCDGQPGRSPTVILIPAGGSTAKDWAMVQPAVSVFSRVCSYDHASHGESDKAPVALQSVDEVVEDLRPLGEHQHVTFPLRTIDHCRLPGKFAASGHHARQEQIVLVRES